MWFYVKWPAGDQLSHSWWSNVGSVVDIHALGFRDAVDKGAVTVSNTGYWKSSGLPYHKALHSTNIFCAL